MLIATCLIPSVSINTLLLFSVSPPSKPSFPLRSISMATFPKTLPFLLLIFSIFLLSEGLEQRGSKGKLQECYRRGERQHQTGPSLEHSKIRCQAEYGGGLMEKEESGERHYVFRKERFVDWLRTEHGYVKVLPNFYQLSRLLLGVSNYRVSVIDLKPRAFLKPRHLDAEEILFVANGRGIIGVVDSESRNTHNVREGDILRIRAGSISYLANKDNNERFVIVKLLHPVSQPGRLREYFPVGLERAYLQRFSREVKRAAFNLNPKEVEELLGGQQQEQQQQGAIIRGSEQQMRSIEGSEGGSSHPSTESRGPFNLYNKRPTHSSDRGRLIEADRNDYQPLRDFDIQVSFANLTKRSMLGPFYNTESYKIALVTQGRGTLEFVCPHLASQRQAREGEQGESEQTSEGKKQESEETRGEHEEEEEEEEEQEQSGPRYERVRTEIRQGTVFVIPPDHATVLISADQNLEVICFETRAEKNQMIFLAGPNNPWRRMEDAVKELTFGRRAREVDEKLSRQKESVILAVPEEREHRPLSNIMDLFGF
ncbi:putative rmlC-like cupin domain superfamily, rmlC-like jelly roll protein [Dioscorea sansibarensis]